MTALLCRLFIKNRTDTKDPAVRRAYGTMVSTVCIVLNLLLCAGKILVGSLFGFVSVVSDGFNNLSDAGSSLISLISARIAAKPADRDHPFGHARVEYISSLAVGFIILFIGIELFKESVGGIFAASTPAWDWLTVAVLGVSVLCKLWMFFFNRKIGRTIDSGAMRATATDSLSDAVATSAVLIGALLFHFFGWKIDAWLGLAVSIFILIAGIRVLREMIGTLMGEKPSDDVVDEISRIVGETSGALGIHDLCVHNYGVGRLYVSLHVEVDGSSDIFDSHDLIDNLEKRLNEELNAQCVIHMDPIVTGDATVDAIRHEVEEAVREIYDGIRIHDFRIVRGPTHTNLIFDAAVPFECKLPENAVRLGIEQKVTALDPAYCVVLTVDRV